MKEALDAAGVKAHLMIQPLAYHTPDCGKQGFIDLPDFPFCMLLSLGVLFCYLRAKAGSLGKRVDFPSLSAVPAITLHKAKNAQSCKPMKKANFRMRPHGLRQVVDDNSVASS